MQKNLVRYKSQQTRRTDIYIENFLHYSNSIYIYIYIYQKPFIYYLKTCTFTISYEPDAKNIKWCLTLKQGEKYVQN